MANNVCNNAAYHDSNSMVLIPGLQWSVPQPHPPVCTPCTGQIAYPVMPSQDQTALIGTLLEDAQNTQVGSLMPKFAYSQEGGTQY